MKKIIIVTKNIINNLKILKIELIQKIKNLENLVKNLNGKIDELKLDNSILNNILKEAENNEPQIIKQLKVLYQKKRTEKLKDNNLKINDKGEIIGNEKMIEVDSTKFYDIIIDINSIKGINKGWIIKKSERIIEEYEKFKEDKIVRVGVIGNSNKGKSFILSKISKIDLPSGTSIRTEGLSIKYPDLETYTNRRIALLDSAGLETPVLKDDKSEEFEKVIDKKIELEETSDIEKIQSGEEKIITELFLQNYIINNSDILIVVVGILTYQEQKLLNRIKTTEIQRAKINKPLYIIHNLKTFTSIKQVEKYISDSLLKSATFELEKQQNISTKINNIPGVNYFEKNIQPPIFHLIFANEGSEAGNFYNPFTLDYIEHTYQTVKDYEPFDVIKTVKERFTELSKQFIEKTENKIIFDDKDNNLIKLKEPKIITLKKCLIDELGFSNLKANGFEPNYNYYKNGDNLIVRVEAPGNCTLNTSIDYTGEYTVIRILGNKAKDKEPKEIDKNIFNNRDFGDFSLDIPLKTEDNILKNEKPTYKKISGLIIMTFNLDQKKIDKGFLLFQKKKKYNFINKHNIKVIY